jgi:murein L,D-transpeptidase YcbB/YkuD
MRLNRRNLLRNVAIYGAAAAVPGVLKAQATESIFDMFARNRILRETDREGNTAQAQAAIETIEPILSFDTAFNLRNAIAQYEPFVAAGGWQEVSKDVYGLIVGNSRQSVVSLKRRLMSSGDLAPADRVDDQFNEDTDRAVRNFQARHGLIVNGQVDEPTFYALNVPAETRLNQLRLNLLRVEGLASKLSDRYVVVNIPAATIEAVESGTVAQRHTAVVGRIDRATPIMASKIHQINFNPYWHVPKSLIEKDLTKYMQEDPEYLTKFRIHIYDGKGNEISPTQIDWTTNEAVNYSFRQEPGGENSMGHCKINFFNPYDVYLHDTPSKSLFAENARFHSSGCVRVDAVNELVSWILRDNGDWDLARVDNTFAANERLDVKVKVQVPIHTTYITAWANRQGTVSFRDDVYQFDAEGKVVFDA